MSVNSAHPSDQPLPVRDGYLFEVYETNDGSWRWSISAEDGTVICRTLQGFASGAEAQQHLDALRPKLMTGIFRYLPAPRSAGL